MTPLILARFALEEYLYGLFANTDGDYFNYYGTGYRLKHFFSKLDDELIRNRAYPYFYLPGKALFNFDFNSDMYIPEALSWLESPSETDLDELFLSDLSDEDEIENIKTNTGEDPVYSFSNNKWLYSWAKISDVFKQSLKISTTYNHRNVLMYNSSSIEYFKRTIRRDSSGNVTSDVTIPSPFEIKALWRIVFKNQIATTEEIYYSVQTYNIIDERALHYENSYLNFDILYRKNSVNQKRVYNLFRYNTMNDNEITHTSGDPRDYAGATPDNGTYETVYANNNGRNVSKIKEYTMQELYEALNVPVNQY